MIRQTYQNVALRRLFPGSTPEEVFAVKIQRSGFTLMELVIVLMVLGILSSATAPRYLDALAHYRVDATAKRIVADLNMARREAKRTSATQRVDFNLVTNSYMLNGFADLDHSGQVYTVSFRNSEYGSRLVSANFSGNDFLTFDHYGRPDNAGTISVQSGAVQHTISVDATGVISIL